MEERFFIYPLLLGIVVSVCLVGCSARNEEKTASSLEDVPLEPYQAELLDIAFSAVSAMPVYPHIKSRSLAQETVVTTCLELEQPQLALRYIEQIDNWRRGAAYAGLAFYYVQHGAMKNKVEGYLTKAAQAAAEAEDWRKDSIRVKIAQVYTWLGQHQQTQTFAADVENSEEGKVARIEAMICDMDSFEEEMEDLEKLVTTANFDITKNALEAYAELYNRFYMDTGRRTLIEEKIKASWNSMPLLVRIDLLMGLADFSLAHEDQGKALELVNEAGTLIDSATWQPRFGIPLKARLAELHFRAGDEEQARIDVQGALNMFEASRKKIVNIYRAQILRSIAEAYKVIGDTIVARDIYKRALEAGIENPNSRPRAEDLMATCCSMALNAVEPDAELLNRIREIRDGLGDPW